MAGYIRQSSFIDGDTITAALFNNEYNQLVNAFSNTSGHKHDGTTAEGPVIGLIGDAGETSPNNKVLIDTTNNYIEFYVEVSSAPVQQLYIADGAIIPVTDNDIDLGTSSLEFKDIYIDGTATIDTLTVDEAATVGTTLGVTGATTLSSTLAVTGTSTLTGNVTATNDLSVGGNLTVTGNATISGNLTFGDADTDSINLAAEIDSNIVPNTDDTYDLGTSTKQWRNLYIDGTAEIDTLAIDGTTVTSTAAELNILDGVTSTAAELNILDGVTSTTAELNILDGVTSTATEINIVDGDTAATSTTLADADRVVVNDNGTMVQVALTDFETYFEGALDTLSNVTTVGALNAGSITSGFGSIDNGSSAITTTGTVTYGSLSDGTITITAFADEDDMSSDSATLVPTQQSVKAYVDSQVTAQDLDATTDSGTIAIDLDSETLTIAGGEGIDTSAATNTITIAGEDASTTNKGIASFSSDDFTVSSGAVSLATTSTAAELNILDGATVTTAELNILDGVTSTAAELNILDGVTSTTAELNILDGVTSTAAELNILDGKAFLDEDNMASNSATGIASQQSIKAYVDTEVGAIVTDVVSDTTPQLGGDLASNGNDILFADNDKAIFGAGSDLQIYHDGSNSRIQEGGTGSLLVRGTNLQLQDSDGYDYLTCTDGGNGGTVALKHLGTTVFSTTSTGIDVTGTIVTDGLTLGDNTTSEIPIYFNSSSTDFSVGANGNNFILAQTTGDLDTNQLVIVSQSGNVGVGLSPSYSASGRPSLEIGGSTQGNLAFNGSGKSGLIITNSAHNGSAFVAVNTGVSSAYSQESGEHRFFSAASVSAGAAQTFSEHMRINSSGNVGIGLTNPSEKLEVSGKIKLGGMRLTSNDSGRIGLNRNPDDGSATDSNLQRFQINGPATGSDFLDFQSYNSSGTYTGSFVFNAGNFGIGTNSPSAGLHVETDVNPVLRLDRGSANNTNANLYYNGTLTGQLSAANAEFQISAAGSSTPTTFFTNGSEVARLDTTGNLLIGTTSGTSIQLNVDGSRANGLAAQFTNSQSSTGSGIVVKGGSSSSNYSADFRDYNNTNLMRLTGEGKLGLGTTSPQDTIHVVTDSSTTNDTVDVARIEATSSGTPAVGFGPTIDFRGERAGASSDSMGRIGFVADNMTASRIDGAYVVETAIDGTYSERMRITSAGNVGIGETSPLGKLHVKSADSGASADGGADELVIEGSGDSGLSILSGASNYGNILFSDSGDAAAGRIRYEHNNNALNFGTNGSWDKFYINSAGNVGIGTTDAGNAKLVINGNTSEGADTACIDFDGFGTRGLNNSQSINFRMGRTGQATDQPAQIRGQFQGGGATAAATHIGFVFNTISANTQVEQFIIDAAYQRFKFNSTESPQSSNPQTNNCIIIGPSTSTAITQGLTNACVLQNRSGELFAVDSSHNNTQLTPHNWTLISDGPSEELAWTYWSQRPNPDNPDQLQGINVDMAKVIRKVEDLAGEKFIYTENSNMDDHTHQNIIADIQSTLADLTTRIEALEA